MIKYAAGFWIGYSNWGLCSVVEINQKVPQNNGCNKFVSKLWLLKNCIKYWVPYAVRYTVWFMHDGALLHVTCNLKQFVDSHYSLIGWNKLVLWPPLSFISLLLPSACLFIWKLWCSMSSGVLKKRLQNASHNTDIRKWNHQLGDLVLAEHNLILEAVEVTAKNFVWPFNRLWKVTKLLSASTHEFADMNGRTRAL